MKATIHWEIDGEEDQMVINAPTIEDLQKIAEAEAAKRGVLNSAWSSDLQNDDGSPVP